MTEYRWYDNGKGRQVYRPVIKEDGRQKSSLSCPYLSLDTIEPTISQADGKEYTSKSALRATYKADGNPQGINYIELGTEPIKAPEKPKRDYKKSLEAIERAEADVSAGRLMNFESLGKDESVTLAGVV